ncbi:MAG TPA: LPS export ABC transporter periplasmic protein LptC [Rhizomicrobium sp.]|jgi:lipopolysaccharide export system protein LptC|nr:LPS export ABC transporter periplasmic protein LptC [Rhizomicrobium sp.]HEX4532790.1 LPS export ABC transporter periplasmic protein LptC [Rhizomicrobium sp.]
MTQRRSIKQAVVQTLGPVPAARGVRDWTARTRGSVNDALRYTRFVTIMKRALPLAAAAILAAVVAYSLQPRETSRVAMTFESIGKVDNDLAMIKPRLTGKDSDGNPFVVTADAAIQDPKNIHHAHLKNVEADMTMKKGGWMSATAATGYLDSDAHKLWLQGPIAVYSDDGNELHTPAAVVDLKAGVIHGTSGVSGQGPMGTMRADRFTVDRAKKTIQLNGHVHMTIDAHAAGGGSKHK